MRLDAKMLGLPASVLLLMLAQSSAMQFGWGRQVAPNRALDARGDANKNSDPVGVMKMSADEGEKFYMEYWQYEPAPLEKRKLDIPLRKKAEVELLANVSIPYNAPLALHTDFESSYEDLKARRLLEGRNAVAALAILEKREFVCPTGYLSCAGIKYPYSCCSTTETCFPITDTGLGPVGCCPIGSTCGGTISKCDPGNTPCDKSLGGGCCIPNYVCAGVGCVNNLTVTTTVTQMLTVPASVSSTSLTTSTTTSTTVVVPVFTFSGSSSSISTSLSIATVSSTATGAAPLRPTDMTAPETTATDTSCPTGFYACSAYYDGGCCRAGRNCDTTSCPPSATIISSGVTIAVPVGFAATTASPTGSCPTGWSSCAASLGGNCCLNGYECGTISCSSVGASTTLVQPKGSPNGALSRLVGIRELSMLGIFWTGLVLGVI